MQTKHTPGPWQAVNGTDVFTRLGARNAAGVKAAANDGWYIADCDRGPSSTEEGGEADIPYVEKLANARLIAAAPELLEAMQQAFDFPPDFFDRSDDELEQITVSGRHLRMVRAAIAKATGAEA